MPSASCKANDSASSVTWPKQSYCTLFWSYWHKECNVTIDDVISNHVMLMLHLGIYLCYYMEIMLLYDIMFKY